jgi:hypothetical protein
VKYIAMIKSGRVTSVWADDPTSAKVQIIDQLSKPGRIEIRKQWQATGSVIVTEEELDARDQAERDNARPADCKTFGMTMDERLFGRR